jgi:hypothetical protein
MEWLIESLYLFIRVFTVVAIIAIITGLLAFGKDWFDHADLRRLERIWRDRRRW